MCKLRAPALPALVRPHFDTPGFCEAFWLGMECISDKKPPLFHDYFSLAFGSGHKRARPGHYLVCHI